MAHRCDLVSGLDRLHLLELLLEHVDPYLDSEFLHHFAHLALRVARKLFAFLNNAVELLPCWRLVHWLLGRALVERFDGCLRKVLVGLGRMIVGCIGDGLVEV